MQNYLLAKLYAFRRACGGNWGTPVDNLCARIPNPTQINVSTPIQIDGSGGTALLNIGYCCYKDYCSGIILLSCATFKSLFP